MCHLRHMLITFSFRRKVMFHSQDIQVFVFLTIPLFTKSVTSWWVLVHDTGHTFEYIFWTKTHWDTKLGQLINTNKGNNLQEIFRTIWKTGAKFQVLYNLATSSNYLITNYVKIPVLHFFEKANKGHLKLLNLNH